MADITVKQSFSVTIDGQLFDADSTEVITVSTEIVFDRTYRVANNALTEIFRAGTAATEDIASWELLWIQSSEDGELRYIMNNAGIDGSTTSEDIHGLVISIRQDVPIMLAGSDDSRGNGAAVDETLANADLWTDETARVIDAVEMIQTSGNSAKVRVVAIG